MSCTEKHGYYKDEEITGYSHGNENGDSPSEIKDKCTKNVYSL